MKEWELAKHMLLGNTCNECTFATVWPSSVWKNCPYRLARRDSLENGGLFLTPKEHPICKLFRPVAGP